MGQNRTPTSILEARGSFINHRNRREARANEPKETRPLGSPPRALTDEQKKIWREFARMAPEAVATFADRWAVELIVGMMTKYRAGLAKNCDLSLLTTLLSRFGLTPADRSRVVATLAPKSEVDWLDQDDAPQTII